MRNLTLLLALMLPGVALAERVDVIAKVEFVISHNSSVFGPDGDWISLQDVSSAGLCGVANNPVGLSRVVFRLPDNMDRAFDIALAAQRDRLAVQLSVDDTIVDAGGYCIVRWITLRRPGPPFVRNATDAEGPIVEYKE